MFKHILFIKLWDNISFVIKRKKKKKKVIYILPELSRSFGKKSFQKAQAVARGPFPMPLLSALKIKYCGWSFVYNGQFTSSVTGFLEQNGFLTKNF